MLVELRYIGPEDEGVMSCKEVSAGSAEVDVDCPILLQCESLYQCIVGLPRLAIIEDHGHYLLVFPNCKVAMHV